MKSLWQRSGAPLVVKQARRAVIFVIGSTVCLLGLIMLGPIPGPGIIIIPAGLAILATEFVWAARLLKRVKQHTQDAYDMAKRMTGTATTPDAPTGEHGDVVQEPALEEKPRETEQSTTPVEALDEASVLEGQPYSTGAGASISVPSTPNSPSNDSSPPR